MKKIVTGACLKYKGMCSPYGLSKEYLQRVVMPPGRPPRHLGPAHQLNNNGKLVKVSAKNGIATRKMLRLPTGEIVKKPRDPYMYLKTTRSVPKSPRKSAPAVIQTTTLKQEEAYKPTGPDNNNGGKSPPIRSRYGGYRRRHTKRRGRCN